MKNSEIRKYGVRCPVEIVTTYYVSQRFSVFGRMYERFDELTVLPLHYSTGDPHRTYYEDI